MNRAQLRYLEYGIVAFRPIFEIDDDGFMECCGRYVVGATFYKGGGSISENNSKCR